MPPHWANAYGGLAVRPRVGEATPWEKLFCERWAVSFVEFWNFVWWNMPYDRGVELTFEIFIDKFIDKRTYIRGGGTYIVFACTSWRYRILPDHDNFMTTSSNLASKIPSIVVRKFPNPNAPGLTRNAHEDPSVCMCVYIYIYMSINLKCWKKLKENIKET